MQKSYLKEFKESIIRKRMPPHAVSIPQLCKETRVSDVTLYKRRKEYRNRRIAVPGDNSKADDWAAEDKLAAVIETAGLNSVQLSEYYRSKGLYPEQIDQWKTAALSGYQHHIQAEKKRIAIVRKQIKRLESELKRKEKALAETADLLVLSKKCEAS